VAQKKRNSRAFTFMSHAPPFERFRNRFSYSTKTCDFIVVLAVADSGAYSHCVFALALQADLV
jgi:hypothetical protein